MTTRFTRCTRTGTSRRFLSTGCALGGCARVRFTWRGADRLQQSPFRVEGFTPFRVWRGGIRAFLVWRATRNSIWREFPTANALWRELRARKPRYYDIQPSCRPHAAVDSFLEPTRDCHQCAATAYIPRFVSRNANKTCKTIAVRYGYGLASTPSLVHASPLFKRKVQYSPQIITVPTGAACPAFPRGRYQTASGFRTFFLGVSRFSVPFPHRSERAPASAQVGGGINQTPQNPSREIYTLPRKTCTFRTPFGIMRAASAPGGLRNGPNGSRHRMNRRGYSPWVILGFIPQPQPASHRAASPARESNYETMYRSILLKANLTICDITHIIQRKAAH
jgi:hypothetical protein